MKNVFTYLVLFALSAGSAWYGWVIYNDLTHPELWDQDPLHDPRLYAPLYPGVTFFVVATMWWAFRTEAEMVWRSRFFDRFLEYVRWKERQGNGQDAMKALELYRELRQWEMTSRK